MNTVYSTNRNFKRTLISVLSIFVILAMSFPAAGVAYAQDANPRMVVSITHDWFQAEEFSPGGTLNVKIYEEQGGPLLWEENRTADESGFMIVEPWQHPVDLKPGNYLVISDGATTKVLIIEAVTLDVFDPSMDYLAGTAPPAPGGRLVWVGVGNDSTGCGMDVIADPVSGAWEADFSTQPCDVTEDMWAAAQVFDEDSDVSEGNIPLIPIFAVFPEWESVEGWFWTQDATVHLEIDDPSTPESPDHFQDAQVVPLPWNPNDVWVRFDFAGVYDVKPGDVVTLSEGTISRTYSVENLAITAVNEFEDTVSGTAEEGETIYVWPHATGQQVEATAGSGGAWEVDFTGMFDLVPGECGRSEVRDVTGNSTAVDWCIANPRFSAFPESEYIEGWEWPLGANIHLTIDDPATGANPDYEDDQQVVVTPWDPNVRWVQFNFNGQYDMKVGDVVTLTDGLTPRTHTVRNLSITGVNQDTEIVSGMADEGATVYVWPHATGQQLEVTAGSGGNWQADFAGIFDIAPGEGGRSEVRDEQGNSTAVDWYVLNPRFAVFPEWEYIEGWEWPAGAVVHLTIDDPVTLESPDYSADEPVMPLPWDPNQLWVTFNFANAYDVKPGDIVTLDDGVTARTHTVRNLGITAVDREANAVAGTAEAGETVHVWPHATGQQLQATVGASGTWQVDFTGIFDLVPNECGRSEIRDADGNSTAVDWCVPPPVTGYHDYDSGNVPSWACYAGGWAMDPDSTFEDVIVRILVDGLPVVEDVKAENYREDLETAWNEGGGGCPGGTCAFEVNLWDIISHYVAHEITVEAQDLQTGEWYSLNATPRTINCRTYDIYTFDPATGEPRQITNLMDTDEYDPSWSPNGKKIVHDVVSSDGSHGLYVTDVRTHVSTPLVGAEDRANDGAWSPNGKWIAFDRRWFGEPNIYLVPDTGGTPQLVRNDAVRADWAPNSKRIVFQQLSDESIRTVAANGGRGEETLIAPNGSEPAWSPDGNWIAYVHDGNIWKVQVNILGRVLGTPIQVTNVSDWNVGSPTWSPDSQTIIFNGGVGDLIDIWKVPASGGDLVWLTGSPNFGDYGPENARNNSSIAFASVSP